jgi:PAS domain S-box-containing protein
MQPNQAKTGTDASVKSNQFEALLNEQLMFSIIMNKVPDKIYFKNRKSEFVRINKNLSDFFGLNDSNEAIGKTDFDFFGLEHSQAAFEDERKIMDTGEPLVEIEEKETWPNGSITWASTTKMPLKNEKGEIIGTYGISRDITIQKNAEESLREKDIMVTKLAENVPGVIYQFQYFPDGRTCFPYASEGISDIFGVTPDKVKYDAGPVFEVIHPDDLMPVFKSIREAYQQVAVWKFEFRVITLEKGTRWLTGEAKPEKQPDDSVLWYGYIHDDTEKKKSERKLESAYQRIKNIMNSVQSGILLIRKSDCVIVDSNPAAEKMIGLKQEHFINQRCTKFICPAEVGNCPVINMGQTIDNSERKIKMADGTFLPVLKNVVTIEIEGEEYLLESFVDISKQKQAESELKEAKKQADAANKSKSEFLANMSHEIRTPMNSILGFSEVMMNTIKDEKHIGYLKTILTSGKTLLSLINDILDLSKIEAGRIEIAPEPVDIRVIINEIKQIFTQKVHEKNIQLFSEIDVDFPANITIDEVRFRQILLNIVGNAVKFTAEGYVKIELKKVQLKNGTIDFVVSVSDTGIGVQEADKQRIFESFSQQSGQTSRHFEGTGLGLAISKKLCELMGGKIELESEVSVGSKFSLLFFDVKYSEEILEQENHYSWDKEAIVFNSSKILVVDDISFNRDLIISYLENYNFTLLEAENGEIGIAMAKKLMPDIILMDIRMPGINGYEATEILKNDKITSQIPVIALTASTMSNETEKINKLFDGYLRKPVQKNSLVTELIKYLQHENKKTKTDFIETTAVSKTENPVDIDDSVKSDFRNEFFEKIDELSCTMIIEDLDNFVERIYIFEQQKNINFLKEKADSLKRHIAEFDFDMITNCLVEIKQFFE